MHIRGQHLLAAGALCTLEALLNSFGVSCCGRSMATWAAGLKEKSTGYAGPCIGLHTPAKPAAIQLHPWAVCAGGTGLHTSATRLEVAATV